MPAEERYARPLGPAPGRLIRRIDEPISVGTALPVFTGPSRGHQFANDRWYERDHYYAGCMIGESTLAGSRWVATRQHKAVRFLQDDALGLPCHAGSYACGYYILDGHNEQWVDRATPQVHRLKAAVRGVAPRTRDNTANYRHAWRAYRDSDRVPLVLALDHRYGGLVAPFLERADGVDQPLPDTRPDFVAVDPIAFRRTLQLHFVEGDPLACWDRYRALDVRFGPSGPGRIVFAAPFVPTEVGTDRCIDELW